MNHRPPNEEMQLTKPDALLVGGRGAHVGRRRAIVFESGFAADLRCSADLSQVDDSERAPLSLESGAC